MAAMPVGAGPLVKPRKLLVGARYTVAQAETVLPCNNCDGTTGCLQADILDKDVQGAPRRLVFCRRCYASLLGEEAPAPGKVLWVRYEVLNHVLDKLFTGRTKISGACDDEPDINVPVVRKVGVPLAGLAAPGQVQRKRSGWPKGVPRKPRGASVAPPVPPPPVPAPPQGHAPGSGLTPGTRGQLEQLRDKLRGDIAALEKVLELLK